MNCSECGTEEAVDRALRDRWCGPVAAEVPMVPSPAYCFGACRVCSGWSPVRELAEEQHAWRRERAG